MKPVGWILTFFCVVAAMALFRSSNLGAAGILLKGMVGFNGFALPVTIYEHVGPFAGLLKGLGVTAEAWSANDFILLVAWIVGTLFIALALPNTLQIVARYEPALGIKPQLVKERAVDRALKWNPSLAWAIGMSIIAALGVYSLGGPSEFLYWQF